MLTRTSKNTVVYKRCPVAIDYFTQSLYFTLGQVNAMYIQRHRSLAPCDPGLSRPIAFFAGAKPTLYILVPHISPPLRCSLAGVPDRDSGPFLAWSSHVGVGG